MRALGQGRKRERQRPVLPLVDELKCLRESAGLSQVELAHRIGVGKEAPGHWERGEHMIDLDDAMRYAQACGFRLVLEKIT